MLRALGRFFLWMFALIGFFITSMYIWARVALHDSWRNVTVDWQVVVPSVIVSALFVAYTSRKANARG